MELTMAEFASFSVKSKRQILDYKANCINSITSRNYTLQLYFMNGSYYVAHVNHTTFETEKIEPVLNDDMLYMFVKDIDISSVLPN